MFTTMLHLLFLLLVTAATAQQTEPFGRTTSCARHCSGASTFSYQNNMVHVYDYHSSAVVLGGILEPQLAVTARVHITVAGPCEMILALSHVRLTGTQSSSPEFAASLTSTPLRFAFHNGRVTNICPSTEEPVWVLNFKRAVLSTFQSTMGELDPRRRVVSVEDDVSGSCTSNYTAVEEEPGVFNVTRVRSSACVSRPVPPSNCRLSQVLQLLPVFTRQQTCYQKISDGVLKDSTCRELIRYPYLLDTPDSRPVVAIVTSVSMAYQFRADFVVIPNYNATRASLMQDWEVESLEPPSEWQQVINDILASLRSISPSPRLFYGLTEILKTLNYDQIQQLFIDASPEVWNTAAMSFISVATEPAMKLMVDLMNSGVLSSSSLSNLVEYLATRFNVTSPMLEMIEKTINSDKRNEVALRKINNYCQINSTCQEDSRVNDVFSDINGYVSPRCSKDREARQHEVAEHKQLEEEELTTVDTVDVDYSTQSSGENIEHLNILRDLGHWDSSHSALLDSCARSNNAEERYATLEALRNSPCNQHNYEDLLLFWQDPAMDNFSQILIYKTLARCFNEAFASAVLNKLLLEDVNQVTSYIWSHISNFQDEEWTTEILADARLRNKFPKELLKFSRHFRRDFEFSNTTFIIEYDFVFSGYSARPQYSSLKITTKGFIPNEIFLLEVRERNVTSEKYAYYSFRSARQDKSTTTYYSLTARVMGYVTYEEEINLSKKRSFWSLGDMYSYIFFFGYRIITSISVDYVYKFFSRVSSVEYRKHLDLRLQYPTTMGIPLKLKANLTTGNQEGALLISVARTLDAQLSLDATHAEIGCKLAAKYEFFPRLNASLQGKDVQFKFNLPDVRNKLVNIEYATYTFENDEITPKYFNNETTLESLCIPGLQELTGYGFCIDYYPRIRYWPIFTFKYGLTYVRDRNLEGVEITYRYNKRNNFQELSVDAPGSPSSSWKISKYELAQFVNVSLATPYFALNGSGTYREAVLFFEESGQAVNISGIFRYRGEEAPFHLISDLLIDEEDKQTIAIDFKSDLLKSNLITSYVSGKNRTFVMSVPYQFKSNSPQRFKISAANREFRSTGSTRINYQTEFPTRFTRQIYSLSVGTTKYRDPLITVDVICEDGDDIDTHSANVRLYYDGMSVSSHGSYIRTPDICLTNCTVNYKDKENKVVEWSKLLSHSSNRSSITSLLLSNNDTIYDFQANYYNDTGRGLYSNSTLLVPNHELDAQHPLYQVQYLKSFNFSSQDFHMSCNRSYNDRWTSFMFSSKMRGGAERPNVRTPAGAILYTGGLSIECSHRDSFKVMVNTTYNSEERADVFEMDANVQTPFQLWNRDSIDVKINKNRKYIKTTLTDKRYKDTNVYNMEGSMDNDIITNLIGYTNERMGKPIE